MKKFLLVLCVCAVLLSGTACKKKNPDTPDNTGDAIETADVVSNDSAESDKTDETKDPSEDPADTSDMSSQTQEAIDSTEPDAPSDETADTADSADTDDTVPSDDSTETKDTDKPKDTEKETDDPKDTENPKDSTPVADMGVDIPEVITPGGTEPGLWPSDSIPEDVPAYEDYSEMYNVTYDEHEESEEWYLSFDSTEDDFDEYIKKLEEAGYKESDKIVGFWGNGEQILNIFTEEVDGEFCVSIDIFKAKPVEYPKAVLDVFPEFKVSDSTLYGWYVTEDNDCKTLSVSYACGTDFFLDLGAYKQQLTDAGFTVTADEATIEKDGKTYIVRYGENLDKYEDRLEYVYY